MARSSFRVNFTGGSGHQLAGIIDLPEETENPPALVFSHCFTCNKDLKAIARISRGLAENGIAVLRYDMTGLGNSDGDFSRTNFSTNLADLTAAIDYARSKFVGPISLLGHSFGGAVSMAYAGLHATEPKLASLITLAAPSNTEHLAALLASMDPAIENSGSGTVTIGGLPWKIEQQMLDDFRQHELAALIRKIRVATLLLHSPADETLSYDHALRIMGLIQQSLDTETQASLVTLPGSDHLLSTNPADIEFVVQIVAAFIRRHSTD